MADEVSKRPRLSLHVSARRQIVDGETCVVLHDRRSDRSLAVGEREWTVLRCADGTRDVEGLVLAAERRGRFIRRDHLEAFLLALNEAGMLAVGGEPFADENERHELSDQPSLTAREVANRYEARKNRPVDTLPGYLFDCDGRGACCRIFPTVLFSPGEALRARANAPELLEGSEREELVFTPERSACFEGEASARGARAVTMIDGRCAFVSRDLRCSLHEKAGPRAKPLGCQLFPTTFVDDGEAIRVSILPDCACVFESIGKPDGEPLVPRDLHFGSDIPPAVHVPTLPAGLPLDAETTVSRKSYVAWSREILVALRSRTPANPACSLWNLADVISEAGLDERASALVISKPTAPYIDRLAPWVHALRSHVDRRSSEQALCRGERDLVRVVTKWLGAGCDRFLHDPRRWLEHDEPSVRRNEAFYCETVFHGHQLIDDRSLVTSLRDRAVRLLLARVLPQVMVLEEVEPGQEGALAQPIALIEPLMRTHGLSDYTAEVVR